MDGSRGKESRKDRKNEFAVEKDFRGMSRNVFAILHGALVSHARRSFSTFTISVKRTEICSYANSTRLHVIPENIAFFRKPREDKARY